MLLNGCQLKKCPGVAAPKADESVQYGHFQISVIFAGIQISEEKIMQEEIGRGFSTIFVLDY